MLRYPIGPSVNPRKTFGRGRTTASLGLPGARLVGLLLCLMLVLPTFSIAQEELEIGGEEEPDASVIEAAVEAVLGRGMEGFNPEPDEAVTLADPEIDPEALRLMLLPLPLDDLANELEAWRQLVEARTRELSRARIELQAVSKQETETEAAATETDSSPAAAAAADQADELNESKQGLIDETAALREARVHAVDRLQVVIHAYLEKGGDDDVVQEYTNYARVVSEAAIDVSDSETAVKTIKSWAVSSQGGMRLLKNAVLLVAAVLGAMLAGWIVSKATDRALKRSGITSTLMRRFLREWIRRIAIVLGLLWGLSLIGFSLVPLLAALGAAGFILAFAFQESLGNFASGLLIVFQRPFDVGDDVEIAGVEGTIERVSLFCTYLSTDENKQVILPNNMIWEDVIVNATIADTRRLSVEFVVDAEHDVEEVERILLKIAQDHPDVLDDPAPDVQLASIGSDGAHFLCRPWVPTEKRDRVRWDLVTAAGKQLKLIRGATKAAMNA